MTFCLNCGSELETPKATVFGNIRMTIGGDMVFKGRLMVLTRNLHQIVTALIAARGRAVTRTHLANRLNSDMSDEAIVKSVERVRKSFREVDDHFDQLETVRGFSAYRWISRPAEQIR